MKYNFLIIIMFSVLIGCNEKAENQQQDSQNSEVKTETNNFKLTLNSIVKKEDDFCLLYTEDGSLDFKEGIWKKVKGSDTEQNIEFSLPPDVFPTQLRIDLGRNLEQDDITIKSIKFEYLGNSRILTGVEMGVFFRADASKCTFDTSTGIVKSLLKDGKKELPSLYPNESILAAELPKLDK